jgi:hypothetical protein
MEIDDLVEMIVMLYEAGEELKETLETVNLIKERIDNK